MSFLSSTLNSTQLKFKIEFKFELYISSSSSIILNQTQIDSFITLLLAIGYYHAHLWLAIMEIPITIFFFLGCPSQSSKAKPCPGQPIWNPPNTPIYCRPTGRGGHICSVTGCTFHSDSKYSTPGAQPENSLSPSCLM